MNRPLRTKPKLLHHLSHESSVLVALLLSGLLAAADLAAEEESPDPAVTLDSATAEAEEEETPEVEPSTPEAGATGARTVALDDGTEIVLDEIIVTAQRREQPASEVPVSVTAFSGDDLVRQNITEASQFLSLTPNVSFTDDGQVGSRGLSIGIRGVTDLKTGENSMINSIGVYLDEFSVGSVASGTINPQLQDLERVEVLRGPQGTYFGRNSVGGALNFATKKPVDRVEASLTLGGSSYDSAGATSQIGGVFNRPITDNFWLRGSAYLETSSGKVDNIETDGADDSGHDYVNVRLSSRWLASEKTTVDLMVMHTDESQGTDETVPSGVWDIDTVDTFRLGVEGSLLSPPDPGTGFYPENRNRLSHDLDERNDTTTSLAVLNLNRRLSDRSAFKLIGGLIRSENDRLFDNDLIGGADLVRRENDNEGTSWSVEGRYESTGDRVDWVVGGLYSRDSQEHKTRVQVGSSAATPIEGVSLLPPPFIFPEGLCLQCTDKEFEVESAAIFGDVTVRLTDRLGLSVGGRFTHDEVTTSLFNSTSLAPGAPYTNTFRADASNTVDFDDFSPRVSLRYEVDDDLSLYGLVSKGYKGGGTSIGHDTNAPGQPALLVPFAEEELWNHELGFKSEWLDRRLRVNGSVFALDWQDLQLEAFRFLTSGDLSSNFEQTINLESAKARGFELEMEALVTENLTLTGGLGYLDSEIDCDCTAELTGGFVVDLQGHDIPKSPKVTANLAAEYRWQLKSAAAYARAEWIHRDGQFADVEALTWKQTRGRFTPSSGGTAFVPDSPDGFPFRTPDYDVVNLRAGAFLSNGWEVVAFVENLFDEEYYTGTQENFGLTGIRLRPHPTTFGANLTYHF